MGMSQFGELVPRKSGCMVRIYVKDHNPSLLLVTLIFLLKSFQWTSQFRPIQFHFKPTQRFLHFLPKFTSLRLVAADQKQKFKLYQFKARWCRSKIKMKCHQKRFLHHSGAIKSPWNWQKFNFWLDFGVKYQFHNVTN